MKATLEQLADNTWLRAHRGELDKALAEDAVEIVGDAPEPATGEIDGKLKVTLAQLGDPAWLRVNMAKRDAALAAGTLEIVG